MTFEEIFENDGLYTSDDFTEGFCFEIRDGCLLGVSYKHKNDLFPDKDTWTTYRGLFKKNYRKVFAVKSLFKD